MCVVLPHILARGSLRPPLHPPAPASTLLRARRELGQRVAVPSLAREPSALPCTPSILSGRPGGHAIAPWTPQPCHGGHAVEAIPLRPTVRRLDADQGCRAPIPATNTPRVGSAPASRRWTPTKETSLDALPKTATGGDFFSLQVWPHWIHFFMMKGKDSGFRIRVERELRDEFVAACRAQDRPAAQVLREFMREFIRNQPSPEDQADLANLVRKANGDKKI